MNGRRSAAGIAAVALFALTLATAGCGGSQPDRTPDLRGFVTQIEPSDAGGSVRVVWTDDPAVGPKASYDAGQVTIDDKTVLQKKAPNSKRQPQPLAFAQLSTGDVVDVWFSGPVAESYPVQAGAERLQLVGRYEGELPVPPGLEPEPIP